MARPRHLPDYTNPPLDEVVLGVQFAPIPGYSSVNAQAISQLFASHFPRVEEHPLLQPQYETFGGVNPQTGFQFQLSAVPPGSRLWFISGESNHLLQFQPDRFIANWRRSSNPAPYPRFEGVAEAFRSNLTLLADHVSRNFGYEMAINQAELSYINIIPVTDFAEAGHWFSVWKGDNLNLEGLNTTFTEIAKDGEGLPFARLHCQIQSVFSVDGKHRAFSLNLTFRGKPAGSDIPTAMRFLENGRAAIVTRFAAITTPQAHEVWGRKS